VDFGRRLDRVERHRRLEKLLRISDGQRQRDDAGRAENERRPVGSSFSTHGVSGPASRFRTLICGLGKEIQGMELEKYVSEILNRGKHATTFPAELDIPKTLVDYCWSLNWQACVHPLCRVGNAHLCGDLSVRPFQSRPKGDCADPGGQRKCGQKILR
jgi:hypothetical protein